MSNRLVTANQPSGETYMRNFVVNIDPEESVNTRLKDINKNLMDIDIHYIRCAWQVALSVILEEVKNNLFSSGHTRKSSTHTEDIIAYIGDQELLLTEQGELSWHVDQDGQVQANSIPFTELCLSIVFQYIENSQVSAIFTSIVNSYRDESIRSEISSVSLVVNNNQHYCVYAMVSW